MSGKFSKKIALLGGSGPWASAYAHTALVRRAQFDYGAVADQDYPEILHLSVPLQGFGAKGIEDAEPVRRQLKDIFNRFDEWGAGVAIIACNSLHSFYDELAAGSKIEIVSLPRSGAQEVHARGISRVGILCSESALKDELHKKALAAHGIEAVLPTLQQQARINRMIELIMGGDESAALRHEFRSLGQEFKTAGAQALLSGCTELSWLSKKVDINFPIVDCLEAALIRALKASAKSKEKNHEGLQPQP